MAGFLKRRKTMFFKVIVGIPVLWFACIGFLTVMSTNSGPGDTEGNPRFWPRMQQERKEPQDQVLERPDPNKMNAFHKLNDGLKHRNERDVIQDEGFGGHEGIPPGQQDRPVKHAKVPTADPKAPGEMGKAVNIDKNKLSPEERRKYDEGWQHNAFNQYASDMMSMHRTLPDVRDPECKSIHYRTALPDTSVIICFHNEAWTVLLRTVYSVLDRSPPNLIKEIILVDDFSDFDHLKTKLEVYVEQLGKVRVVRTKKREGLIRARLLGASVAKGAVLTYLDSHCECTEGWLEPLLDRIAENKSNVVTPVIDVIDDETLRYQFGTAKTVSVGGFDWNMQFNWHAIPERERLRRGYDVAPVRSPTMAGGLFSISREYFEYLGTYDPGMDIWGGENLELSFRIWMCGGTLEIIPCSHVGHIFRKRSPYSWKTGVNVVKKNSVRVAEVWMDDYKNYYYERFNHELGDYGDVSARKQLRKRLKCKSFKWYISNVYPDLFIPGDALASGEVRNKNRPKCLDSPVDKLSVKANSPINIWPCHNMGGNQYWMLSKSGEIRRDEGCMDYAGQFVMIYPCHGMKGNQEWLYEENNTIRHRVSNLCMELSADGQKLEMKTCTGSSRQLWQWKRKTPDVHRDQMLR